VTAQEPLVVQVDVSAQPCREHPEHSWAWRWRDGEPVELVRRCQACRERDDAIMGRSANIDPWAPFPSYPPPKDPPPPPSYPGRPR